MLLIVSEVFLSDDESNEKDENPPKKLRMSQHYRSRLDYMDITRGKMLRYDKGRMLLRQMKNAVITLSYHSAKSITNAFQVAAILHNMPLAFDGFYLEFGDDLDDTFRRTSPENYDEKPGVELVRDLGREMSMGSRSPLSLLATSTERMAGNCLIV